MVMGDLRRPLTERWADEVEDETLRSDIAVCVEHEPDRRLATAAALAKRLRDLDNRRRAGEIKAQRDDAGDRESGSTRRPTTFIKLRCGKYTGQEGNVLMLVGRRFTFGRDRVTVKVPAGVVSRRHAELKLSLRGWVVHDLQSHNGTFLNGEQIETARIRVGSIVGLGAAGAHYTVIALEDAL